MSLTTIPLDTDTRDELKELGKKGESWDTLLNRMIKINKSYQFMTDLATLGDPPKNKEIITNEIPKPDMNRSGFK